MPEIKTVLPLLGGRLIVMTGEMRRRDEDQDGKVKKKNSSICIYKKYDI